MKEIFLESHNLRNPYSGLGQFNLHLIDALMEEDPQDLRFIVNTSEPAKYKKKWGEKAAYHRYLGMSRYPLFRPRTSAQMWHSLNQNTKIEPRSSSLPYLMTVHDVNFVEGISNDPLHPVNQRFNNKLQRSNALVYISEYAKKSTHDHFQIPDIPEYVVYNGNSISISDLPNDYQPVAPPSFPYLFSIGEFRAKKNFHTLVEMMPFLEDSLHLIIAGSPKEPYYTKVLEHIEKHQLKDRVHLLGKISELDKLYYYQNAEAFVFPSLREGFGIPPIEAMSFGIPIFLSDTTSLPEVGGENAFYWENFKPQYMAETLKKGLKQYATKPAWYATQYKNRANEFSWKTAAKSYIKIYRSILENET